MVIAGAFPSAASATDINSYLIYRVVTLWRPFFYGVFGALALIEGDCWGFRRGEFDSY